MKIKEFLEYVSEALMMISLVIYFSTRLSFTPNITTIDIAYILAFLAFTWSRGYAEYLERALDTLKNKINKKLD